MDLTTLSERTNQIKNSDLIKHIILAIHKTTSRRTSEIFSALVLKDIIKELQQKYDFLKFVKIKELRYLEDKENLVKISAGINLFDKEEIGKFIESLLRVAASNIKNKEASLYFIKETKEQINEKYEHELKNYGVDLAVIQLEQHLSYKKRRDKSIKPEEYSSNNFKSKPDEESRGKYVSFYKYKLENIGFWKYKDNICTIYDKKGRIIDKIPLDDIVKDYVMKVRGFDNNLAVNEEESISINEKEYKFLQLIHSKDLDSETAIKNLKISQEELFVIIRKLLVYDVLKYVSFDEVMLTNNGIILLNDINNKKK
jgi:hypothetical protein